MSNVKKALFVALCDHLMQKLQFQDIPSVKIVDKDLGQAELMQSGVIALPLPAVLISFPGADFEGMMSKDQTAEGSMRVRVMFENYLDATAGNPNRDMALQFFEFNERVHNAVNNLALQNVGGITRVGENEDDDHNNVIVTDIFYRFTMYDIGEDNNTYTSGSVRPGFKKEAEQRYIANDFVIPKSQ